MKKRIGILGSTGSIGTQALEVIECFPDVFTVEALSSNNNVELLIKQAKQFRPSVVIIANKEKYKQLKQELSHLPIEVYGGSEFLSQVVTMESIDIVLTAMVGYSGLLPTINAIKAGKDVALANKETLVVGGELITQLSKEHKTNIIPVDSEHSAIFQCLRGELDNSIEKIILTASGGPFRNKDLNYLKTVKKEEALKHPNWKMGAKVTIDSATLMNKGLEAIEAKWLFDVNPTQIQIVIHPQSIIHSMVQFEEGSIKAQMGLPDMKLPIQYALSYPKRLKSGLPRFNFADYPNLSFESPDFNKFRNLSLAFHAMNQGGSVPCVMNAANEVAVEAFLNDRLGFLQISEVIERTMEKVEFIAKPTYNDYVALNEISREIAISMI
jgi:1-deoxy-D-xylulose-5-phosphate reductoisomerase